MTNNFSRLFITFTIVALAAGGCAQTGISSAAHEAVPAPQMPAVAPPSPSSPTAKRIMLADRYPDDVKSPNRYVDGDAAVAAVDAALVEAKAEHKRVLIIVGTDICHDTRGLLGWMKQADSIALLDANYVRVLVDSGSRKDRNLPLLKRFGVNEIKYTPTVLVIDPSSGKLVNAEAISQLGSADSQDPAAIAAYFKRYASSD